MYRACTSEYYDEQLRIMGITAREVSMRGDIQEKYLKTLQAILVEKNIHYPHEIEFWIKDTPIYRGKLNKKVDDYLKDLEVSTYRSVKEKYNG